MCEAFSTPFPQWFSDPTLETMNHICARKTNGDPLEGLSPLGSETIGRSRGLVPVDATHGELQRLHVANGGRALLTDLGPPHRHLAVKNRTTPRWVALVNWKQGLKLAALWWIHFDPYPRFHLCRGHLGPNLPHINLRWGCAGPTPFSKWRFDLFRACLQQAFVGVQVHIYIYMLCPYVILAPLGHPLLFGLSCKDRMVALGYCDFLSLNLMFLGSELSTSRPFSS